MSVIREKTTDIYVPDKCTKRYSKINSPENKTYIFITVIKAQIQVLGFGLVTYILVNITENVLMQNYRIMQQFSINYQFRKSKPIYRTNFWSHCCLPGVHCACKLCDHC